MRNFACINEIDMKKILLTLSLAIFGLGASAQTGAWTGTLEIQGYNLPLVFHLDDDHPTVDSPEQNAKGIPVTLERTENGITVSVPMIGAKYEGVCDGERIEGIFSQGGYFLPLTLRPVEEKKD